MKNCITYPSSLKNIAYMYPSFFSMRNIITFEVFSWFSVPKFDLILFCLIERSTWGTYHMSQATWLVLVDFFHKIYTWPLSFHFPMQTKKCTSILIFMLTRWQNPKKSKNQYQFLRHVTGVFHWKIYATIFLCFIAGELFLFWV